MISFSRTTTVKITWPKAC